MRKILNMISWLFTIVFFSMLIKALMDNSCSVVYLKRVITFLFVSLIGSISGTPDFEE